MIQILLITTIYHKLIPDKPEPNNILPRKNEKAKNRILFRVFVIDL